MANPKKSRRPQFAQSQLLALRIRRILKLPTVALATGLSPAEVYKAVQAGLLKPPVKLKPGGRASGWPEDEIFAYQQARIAERDAELEKRKRATAENAEAAESQAERSDGNEDDDEQEAI